MNKIEKMIRQLCPNGVEYKEIWEITAWDKLFNNMDRTMQKKVIKYPYLLASDMFALEVENGNVKLLSTGNKEGWTTEELAGANLCEGEVVAMPWGGTPNIKYYKGKFVTADNRIATSLDTNVLHNKFLYYWMQSRIDEIGSFYRGSGIKHPDMYKVLTMQIPLPPIEIQKEIVRILDNFTSLTAELTARNKQYEYYRDKLLNGDSVDVGARDAVGAKQKVGAKGNVGAKRNVGAKLASSINKIRIEKLGDIGFFYGGLTGKNKKDFESGNEKYITYMNVFANSAIDININDKVFIAADEKQNNVEIGDIIFTGSSETSEECGMSSVLTVPTKQKLYLNSFCFGYRLNDKNLLLPQFSKYLFRCSEVRKQIIKTASGVTRFNILKEKMKNVLIKIPPIEVQHKIVSVLDNFEQICKDLNIGLPAEIEARKKQYEYYRDALLNFVESGKMTDRQTDRQTDTLSIS